MTLAPWAPMQAPPLPTTAANQVRCVVLSTNPTPGKQERITAHQRMLNLAARDGYASIRRIRHTDTVSTETTPITIGDLTYQQPGVYAHEYHADAIGRRVGGHPAS